MPSLFSRFPAVSPFEARSTTSALTPFAFGTSLLVRTKTMRTSATPPEVIHIFVPFST